MAIFQKLRGTFENIFQIGKSGKQLSSSTTDLSVVDTDGSTLVPLKVGEPTTDEHATNRYWVRSQSPLITFNFDGTSAPSPGTNTGNFGFCHTSGGGFNAGYIYYDNGSALVSVPRTDGSRMLNISGDFSGIAGNFKDDNEYFFDTGTSTWRRVGPIDMTAEGAVKTIKVDVTTATANSTNVIPANSVVHKVMVNVTTPYSPATSQINVGTTTDNTLLMATTNDDNDPTSANIYIKEQLTNIGTSSSALVVTIDDGSGGTPTSGAATVVVFYSIPLD